MTEGSAPGGTLALLCAMPMELKPLVRRLGLQPEQRRGVAVHAGHLGPHPIVAAATGMGPGLATSSTERLLTATTVSRVLVFGITGAVDDDIEVGTVVRPALVVDAASGREHRPDVLDDEPVAGTMWTTNVITPPSELPALRAKGVLCLDMETAAIAQSCERRSIPWSVHRAISDRATDGPLVADAFSLAHQDGSPDWPAVTRYFVRHPRRIPAMARLGRGTRLATERAVDDVVAAARLVG